MVISIKSCTHYSRVRYLPAVSALCNAIISCRRTKFPGLMSAGIYFWPSARNQYKVLINAHELPSQSRCCCSQWACQKPKYRVESSRWSGQQRQSWRMKDRSCLLLYNHHCIEQGNPKQALYAIPATATTEDLSCRQRWLEYRSYPASLPYGRWCWDQNTHQVRQSRDLDLEQTYI